MGISRVARLAAKGGLFAGRHDDVDGQAHEVGRKERKPL
jgi:hypothetical protein